MSRTKVTVKAVYWDLARALGYEPDSAISTESVPDAVLKAALLRAINNAHDEAYNANEWEDAWMDGTLTVTNGVIAWSVIADAARFSLWSADPRPYGSSAYPLRYVSSNDGLHVRDNASSVFAFWLPPAVPFTDAESETDKIIPAIASAVVDMARAEYLRTSGQHETAARYEQTGLNRLEKAWAVEFQRVAARTWLRNQT